MKKYLVPIIVITMLILIGLAFLNPYFRMDRFGGVEIEWVDFIQINDKMYHAKLSESENGFMQVNVKAEFVGKEIVRVKFRLADNVHGENYVIRNLDASYLEEGTRIYSYQNLQDTSSIVIEIKGEYFLYSTIYNN